MLFISQALASLARATGPAWGGWTYHAWGYAAPFLIGGGIMAMALAGSLFLLHVLARKLPAARAVATRRGRLALATGDMTQIE